MNRRIFFVMFCVLLLALSFSVEALGQQPQKIPRIGFLSGPSLSTRTFKPRIEVLLKSLRDLKYIEGQNISIEWRSAEGVDERLPNLAGELVQLKVDVIITQGTPATQAAKNVTKSIRIIMTNVSDPIRTLRLLATRLLIASGFVTFSKKVYNFNRGTRRVYLL